ncbi:MAG: carboxypeptidase-like regulatory domain-containing protein [Bacteroidales bacterium]
MRTIALIFLLIIGATILKAQEYTGVVINKDTNEPISYVSIGIIDTPFGTYSDKHGDFRMFIKDYEETDSLRFSCIGFYPVCYKVEDFIKLSEQGLDTIFLEEKITELDEVVITNTNYETKKLGNKRSTQQLIIGFFGNREHGILIENNEKLFLKKVSFKLTMAGGEVPDSAIFRFNVYNLKDGLPHKNILKQPVYFHLNEDQFYGKNEFDISKYNIIVEEDFVPTFELIEQHKGSRIYFAAWFKGCLSISRKGKQGKWEQMVADKREMELYMSLKIDVVKIP